MTEFVIGTRASDLALAQAREVARSIERAFPDISCSITCIETSGDLDRTSPLGRIGGNGVFVKHLEEELLAGAVDCCVHSLKDVPTCLPNGLHIGAVSLRADARDALVSRLGPGGGLPAGSRVGTGSARRRLQLERLYPDVEVVPVRGNVDTRIGLVRSGELDAVVVAAAGLERLGRADDASVLFSTEEMVPAPGQGALAVELRVDDEQASRLCSAIDDPDTHADVSAERLVMARIGAGCTWPLGVHVSRPRRDLCTMDVFLASEDGDDSVFLHRVCEPDDLVRLSRDVAEELLASSLVPMGLDVVGEARGNEMGSQEAS
jgi:hydroxymethylbilane synthase